MIWPVSRDVVLNTQCFVFVCSLHDFYSHLLKMKASFKFIRVHSSCCFVDLSLLAQCFSIELHEHIVIKHLVECPQLIVLCIFQGWGRRMTPA